MRRDLLEPLRHTFVLGLILGASVVCAAAQTTPKTSESGQAVACRVLEAKVVEEMGVALIVFHQAERSDGARLGELLRQNDGAKIKFKTSDGRTHTATLLRLGTCFGRGLLVFPAGSARLARHDQFWLKFPAAERPPATP